MAGQAGTHARRQGRRVAKVYEIDLATITEQILCCPNDPDDAKPLSQVAGAKIDEVFIGSCMTNIGHYRAAGKVLEKATNVPTRIWIAPPTKMDQHQLTEEGYYSIFGKAGARTEMPGCSLCMGNQARVKDGATVMSTSTRNFPNRLGKDANVYLASAELSAVAGILGRIPTMEEYLGYMKNIDAMSNEIYRYLNFHEMAEYKKVAVKLLNNLATGCGKVDRRTLPTFPQPLLRLQRRFVTHKGQVHPARPASYRRSPSRPH